MGYVMPSMAHFSHRFQCQLPIHRCRIDGYVCAARHVRAVQKRCLRQRFSVENKKRFQSWQQDNEFAPSNGRTVPVPRALAHACNHIINNCGLRRRTLRKDTQKLHDFLFGRRVVSDAPVEQGIESDFHPTLTYGPREAVTFLAGRQPLCYGATHMVLKELQLRRPDFAPSNVLDYGTGTASAIWAVETVWPSTVNSTSTVLHVNSTKGDDAECTTPPRAYVGIDLSLPMLEIAANILETAEKQHIPCANVTPQRDVKLDDSSVKELPCTASPTGEFQEPQPAELEQQCTEVPKNVTFRQTIPVPTAGEPAYDLVTSAFSLCEIKSAKLRRSTLLELWRNTSDYLVLIESGNIQGFSLMQEARNTLIGATAGDNDDGVIVAPCTHMLSCPRADVATSSDGSAAMKPCHFPIRAEYPQTQRFGPTETKSGIRAEKISYLIFARKRPQHASGHVGRVVGAMQHRSGHLSMQVCTTEATLPLAAATRPHGRNARDGDGDAVAASATCASSGGAWQSTRPRARGAGSTRRHEDDSSVIRVVTVPRSGGKDAWRDCKTRQWGDVVPLDYPKLIVAQPQG